MGFNKLVEYLRRSEKELGAPWLEFLPAKMVIAMLNSIANDIESARAEQTENFCLWLHDMVSGGHIEVDDFDDVINRYKKEFSNEQ